MSRYFYASVAGKSLTFTAVMLLMAVVAVAQPGSGERPPKPTPTPKRTIRPKFNVSPSLNTEIMEAQDRADEAKKYLVDTRGIEEGRITVLRVGCRNEMVIELWLVPAGALMPPINSTKPCGLRAELDVRAPTSSRFVKTNSQDSLVFRALSSTVNQDICQRVKVSCRDYTTDGSPFFRKVNVSARNSAPTFNWTFSSGRIHDQDIALMRIDKTGYGEQTTSVNVCGYYQSRSYSASRMIEVSQHQVRAEKFDEYNNIDHCDEQIRLDYLAIALQAAPTAHVYIIVYARAK